MFFKDRKELADKAEQWMEENHVAKTPLSVISYLEAMGWLKVDNNLTKIDNENDELSRSEKPNMPDIISRQDAIGIGYKIVEEMAESKIDWAYLREWVRELYTDLPSVQPDVPDKNVGDTIYRQDVIDAIPETRMDEFENCGNCELLDRGQVIDIIKDLPSAQPETLTDKEQRIFLAAMGKEEKICKEVDEVYRDCNSLVRTCHEITRKVKGALWDGN